MEEELGVIYNEANSVIQLAMTAGPRDIDDQVHMEARDTTQQ